MPREERAQKKFISSIYIHVKTQLLEANNKLRIIKLRPAHYSEVVGSTDIIFGMQGALMCLVETLQY